MGGNIGLAFNYHFQPYRSNIFQKCLPLQLKHPRADGGDDTTSFFYILLQFYIVWNN